MVALSLWSYLLPDFGGILFETYFCQIFFVLEKNFANTLLDISQECEMKKEVHWFDTGWAMWPRPLTSPMNLTLEFSRWNLKKAVSQELLSD